ncbi:MAG TPA: hypothetical protein VMI54_12395 [Polyangiaceae bacterium]|nr:hypothetical protein [Polyangiaceae bacterium]
MRGVRVAVALIGAGACLLAGATAAHAAPDNKERPLTTSEIEGWLEAEPGATPADKGAAPGSEVPLVAPRRHGFVVESGLGFVSQIGALEHIAPTAPDFQLHFGYEVLHWLMPFVEADVAFASTAYASEPPPPRSYFHYGAGAGLRFTVPIGRIFAILAQGSAGFARVSEQNVLSVYGFPNADALNLYLDGELGFEWYQVNPHLALAVHGGIRDYGKGLTRDRGGQAPIALVGSAALRYAF